MIKYSTLSPCAIQISIRLDLILLILTKEESYEKTKLEQII